MSNHALKNHLFRYFTANNTLRYIEALPKLVKAYNERIHSSIKIAPIDVTKKKEKQIWNNQYLKYFKIKNNKYKFKIHDKIRLSKVKKTFKRGYLPSYTE